MADQTWLLAHQAEIEAIVAEIKGMEAENQVRAHRGEAPAYNEAAFQAKAEMLNGISYQLWRNRG